MIYICLYTISDVVGETQKKTIPQKFLFFSRIDLLAAQLSSFCFFL